MTMYNNVVLADKNLNNVVNIPFDYYTIASTVLWEGFIYNDTTVNIVDCIVSTTDEYAGVVAISGGNTLGYQTITSDLNSTCRLGAINAGGITPIVIRVCITGGLTGYQSAPLYISK